MSQEAETALGLQELEACGRRRRKSFIHSGCRRRRKRAMEEVAKHILSYGAGVNSTALMVVLISEDYPLDSVVFADTGAERPETYRYLRIAEAYCKERGVPFHIVRSNNGGLYETCKRRRVIPSMIWRWSTRDYKITPIFAFYRLLGCHIFQYVGIAFDEIERMRISRANYVTNVYPLIDKRFNREDCTQIIRDAGLPVPVKSGCFFCPFNTRVRWYDLYKTQRKLFWKAVRLEESSKHFPKQRLSKVPLRKLALEFRHNKSGTELLPIIDVPCGGECMT